MTMLMKTTALIIALTPSLVAAQLQISVSPSANVVHAGSTLQFTAVVQKPESLSVTYRLRCSEPTTGCGYPAQDPSTATETGGKQTLTFKSYTVPSSLAVGSALCFELYVPGKSVNTPYGRTVTIMNAVVVASACKPVSAPHVAAGDLAKGGSAAPARAVVPDLTSGTGARNASSSGSSGAAVARSSVGALPDLIITFEKAPTARWIVRNVGGAKSAKTNVEFRRGERNGRSLQSTIEYVGELAPGESFAILVVPKLDVYLINSVVEVDAASAVKELDEMNNLWSSVDIR